MRKNAVNRQLNRLEGGVCAVAGFTANTARCGFVPDFTGDDIGIILADKKCAVALLGNGMPMAGAPVKMSRKHVKSGYAKGVLFNTGIANVYGAQSERLAKLACWEVAKRLKIDANDFVIASTGEMGKTFDLETFASGVPALLKGLDFVLEKDLALATALQPENPKQLAFSFEIGDFVCKIGAVFKGNRQVAPNFATTLCFMTTDVNISSAMLQKALQTVVNDTFNQLSVDCISSPNDCVCMLANGKAGNYKITVEDTEYKKFLYALNAVVDRICKSLVCNSAKHERAFLCKVKDARSKKLAREISKSVVQATGIQESLSRGELLLDDLLCLLAQNGETIDFTRLDIAISSPLGRLVLWEENVKLALSQDTIKAILHGGEVTVEIAMHQGNYTATAYGRIRSVVDNGV